MADRLAVLGHPIAHSLSPVLHRAAYRSLGLDWSYEAFDVTEDEFPAFVAGLDESWVGLSLTMPLKHVALSVLDTVPPAVETTGAANTLVVVPHESGLRFRGANTDVAGIITALGEAGAAWWPSHADLATGAATLPPVGDQDGIALVVGAGATAASSLAALAQVGIDEVHLLARSPHKTAATAPVISALGLHAHYHPMSDFDDLVACAQVAICTLPGGAADSLVADGRGLQLAPGALLLDVAYNIRPSALGRAWQAGGGHYVSGERMLLHQAVEQVRLFTGHDPDVAVMDEALRAAM